jgi:hypothetical protein
MLGISGVVMDLGTLYNTKSHLQKTVDAAVLSGAQELTQGEESVRTVVMDILKAHKEGDSSPVIAVDEDNYKLSLSIERDIPMGFLKLFGINSMKATVSSSAQLVTMTRAKGTVPLGIDESIPLEYMKEYSLKVDSGDSQTGNFGILALSGTGAKLYEQDLMYGYDGEIRVGDIIDTQAGNISGKTQNAIDYRINSSPYVPGDVSHRSDPRIILVLVYRPYIQISNQVKQVLVTGFAYFYIKSPMDKHDSSITGYFIKRAGSGYGEPGINSSGAYTIRLVE